MLPNRCFVGMDKDAAATRSATCRGRGCGDDGVVDETDTVAAFGNRKKDGTRIGCKDIACTADTGVDGRGGDGGVDDIGTTGSSSLREVGVAARFIASPIFVAVVKTKKK